MESRGADQHLLGLVFPSPIQHESEIDPAFDCQLHGCIEMVAQDPGMPKSIFAKALRICQCWQLNR